MGYRETYQQLQAIIFTSQEILSTTLSTASDDVSAIKKSVQAIESYFRDQILQFAPITDNPTTIPNLDGIHVEINKQLRLLKTDCLFLQSAKQANTRQQRLQQINDRLTLLQRYCEMALTPSSKDKPL